MPDIQKPLEAYETRRFGPLLAAAGLPRGQKLADAFGQLLGSPQVEPLLPAVRRAFAASPLRSPC